MLQDTGFGEGGGDSLIKLGMDVFFLFFQRLIFAQVLALGFWQFSMKE